MTQRRSRLVIVCTVMLAMLFSIVFAQQAPTTNPAAPPTTGPTGARGVEQILMDVQRTGQELNPLLNDPSAFTDAARRTELATKTVPLLKRMGGFADELAKTADPRGQLAAKQIGEQVRDMLALFGEPDATAELQKLAAGSDEKTATRAKSMQIFVRWVHAGKDADAQKKILDEIAALAKSNPSSEDALGILTQMATLPAANEEVSTYAKKLVQDIEGDRPPKNLENKPLTIKGTTVDGKEFSTDQWKGKVVLVDFWATWCGPCIAELPRVKKVYADYHDKGFEILGVSNDFSADELKSFVTKDPGMPWPQLFDATAAAKQEWHPITAGYGIHAIPVMFLIDKKGVVRSVSAREDFEKLIPQLLAETN